MGERGVGCKVRSEERASPTDRRKTWEDTKGCTTDEGCASSVLASVPIPLGLAAVVATGVAGQPQERAARLWVLVCTYLNLMWLCLVLMNACVLRSFSFWPGFCEADVKLV